MFYITVLLAMLIFLYKTYTKLARFNASNALIEAHPQHPFVEEMLMAYQFLERAWLSCDVGSKASVLTWMHIRYHAISLHMLSTRTPFLSVLKEAQAKTNISHALYCFLTGHSLDLSDDELDALPYVLQIIITNQRSLELYVIDRDWTKFVNYLNNLNHAERQVVYWQYIDLTSAQLNKADFSRMYISSLNLTHANLTDSHFENTFIGSIKLDGAVCINTNWRGTNITNKNFTAQMTTLDETSYCFFKKMGVTDFRSAIFTGNFREPNFSDVSLAGAIFQPGGVVTKPTFQHANLSMTCFNQLISPKGKHIQFSSNSFMYKIEQNIFRLWQDNPEAARLLSSLYKQALHKLNVLGQDPLSLKPQQWKLLLLDWQLDQLLHIGQDTLTSVQGFFSKKAKGVSKTIRGHLPNINPLKGTGIKSKTTVRF